MKWHEMKAQVRGIIQGFISYAWKNRYVLATLAAFTCLVHGHKIFHITTGIDTEKIIYDQKGIYDSWLGIGRQGLVILKKVLGTLQCNLYFAGILTLAFLVISCFCFTFLFEYVKKQRGYAIKQKASRWISLAFCMIVIGHPILTEQLYFTLQSAEVTFSFLLIVLCLLASHLWARRAKLIWLFISVLFMFIPFSTYQAMIPLFLFGVVALSNLRVLGCGQDINVKKEFVYVTRMAIAFFIGFFSNMIVTKQFFETSTYVSSQVLWVEEGIWQGIREILSHVRDTVCGGGVFYTRMFFWLALGLLLLSLRKVAIAKKMTVKIWQLFLLIALYMSPFYLTIVMGMRPVIRGQIVLPFVMGFMAYMTGSLIMEMNEKGKLSNKWAKIFSTYLVIVSLGTIWGETDNTTRLYYAEAVRYEEDIQFACMIRADVAKFTGSYDYDGVIVFLGKREATLNASCKVGDVMGRSFFAWDSDVEPFWFWSTGRIVGFLRSLGAKYEIPTSQQVQEATVLGKYMNTYPKTGSIKWCGDAVVVKLSEE